MFKNRLLDIINYLDSNPTKFGKDLGYSSSEKIRRLTKYENANPSYQILKDICTRFPQIDIKWLLSGQGEMLKSESDQCQELETQYRICPLCKEKDERIKTLERLIAQMQNNIDILNKK